MNNASIRWHYSTQRPGGWPTGMLRALGLEALQHKWPQASTRRAPASQPRLLRLPLPAHVVTSLHRTDPCACTDTSLS